MQVIVNQRIFTLLTTNKLSLKANDSAYMRNGFLAAVLYTVLSVAYHSRQSKQVHTFFSHSVAVTFYVLFVDKLIHEIRLNNYDNILCQ